MCEPVTIMTSLAVASTAASIVSQVRGAKAQEAAIRDQLQAAEQETNSKAVAEINERQRAARREQARIKVAAGQAGLQLGGSIDTLLQDSLMQAGLAEERITDNRDTELRNTRREANSMLSRVESPTLLGAGLQLASSAVSGYSAGKSLQLARAGTASKAAARATKGL